MPGSLGLAFMVAWWLVFGPVALGGPATFTIVSGRSMEPTFRDGDLVIARERTEYGIGDVIVFPVSRGRVVIHRIIDGDTADGWVTQGDNNDRRDSWVVPDSVILGEKWLYAPRAGLPFRWTQQNPIMFGTLVGVLVVVAAVGLRRRLRLHPFLADSVRSGRRISPVAERPPMEVLLLFLACFTTVVASIGVGLLASVGRLLRPGTLVLLVPGVAAFAAVVFLVRRLGDGVGVDEPRSSMFVLSSRCWEVDSLPRVLDYVDHSSPHDLREVLDRFRLPVLLRRDGRGTHTFLTITKNAIGHRWTVTVGADDPPPSWPPPVVTVVWPPPEGTSVGPAGWAPPVPEVRPSR